MHSRTCMQARVQVRAEVQIAPAASCDCSGYRRADADAVPVWTSLPRRSRLTTALHHGVVAVWTSSLLIPASSRRRRCSGDAIVVDTGLTCSAGLITSCFSVVVGVAAELSVTSRRRRCHRFSSRTSTCSVGLATSRRCVFAVPSSSAGSQA